VDRSIRFLRTIFVDRFWRAGGATERGVERFGPLSRGIGAGTHLEEPAPFEVVRVFERRAWWRGRARKIAWYSVGMNSTAALSDRELLARMPSLVSRERRASAEVVAHLVEIERRRLYLGEASSSLFAYCRERLGYSEDEALKRMRVARLAQKVPAVLDELRSGAIHLTGLSVLSNYLAPENANVLLPEARGKSRREIERLVARLFPRPDVEPRVTPIAGPGTGGVVTGPGTGADEFRGRVEPLSASRYRVEFSASREFCGKLERARELLSHSVPSGDLATLFERALDELIEREVRRREGAGVPRKRRELRSGSRRVPVEVARLVWERDGARCAFVNAEGRRCSERRFLTLEHRLPFAFGGPPTIENVCLLCAPHNLHTAREAFGQAFMERKRAQRKRPARTPDGANTDAKRDAKAETHADAECEAKTETHADAECEAKTETHADAECEAKTETHADAECEAETDAKRESKDETGAKLETETETDPKLTWGAARTQGTRSVYEQALSALTRLGFGRSHVVRALDATAGGEQDAATLVRAALVQLTPQLPRA